MQNSIKIQEKFNRQRDMAIRAFALKIESISDSEKREITESKQSRFGVEIQNYQAQQQQLIQKSQFQTQQLKIKQPKLQHQPLQQLHQATNKKIDYSVKRTFIMPSGSSISIERAPKIFKFTSTPPTLTPLPALPVIKQYVSNSIPRPMPKQRVENQMT